MAKHKNSNEAVGNYGIYEILIQDKTYKIGKADLDRITKLSGDPTRLHQQLRILAEKYGMENVEKLMLEELFDVSTAFAKEVEQEYLQTYYENTGEVPEGNKKSFKPKQN